jgi:myo-inositol-1(or 4)-monophosphatase
MYRRAESRFVDRPFDSTRDEGLSEQFPRSASGRNALGVAVEAARNAGDVILKRSDTHKEISFKGRANVVTDVDVLAEKVALELLRHEYPNFGILSEESEPLAGDSRYTWVVDPLDGSRNYASGIPHVAVVVALALDDEVVLGVTYDPIRDELYTAEKGQGAYLNDVRISVSPREMIADCLLGFDMGYVDEKAVMALDMIKALWPGMQSIRIMGSSALGLAYAACGRVDIYFHHHLAPWDIASGLLLVSEAGGRVADRRGNAASLENESVIASSPHLLEAFLTATEGLEWRR